ncbi:hypothetical protein LAZ67_17000580, partial [Cordylochernes scorpioides]
MFGLTKTNARSPFLVLLVEAASPPSISFLSILDASSDPVVLNPNIDIPKYDGTEDPRPWIESLEEIGFLYHWADYIISRYAAMNMIGSAKTWLNLHKISFTSWENFKSCLIEDFASDANKEEMKMRLNRMQQWNEPAIRFAEDILVLCNKVDPQMKEETKINWVIGGLKKEYSFALHLNPPKNTNELLEICKKLDLFEKNYQERAEKSRALYIGPRSPRPHHQEQWKNATSFRRPYQNTSKPQAPAPRYYQNTSKPQAPTPRYYQNKPLPQVSAPRRSYTPNPEPKPVYPSKTYNKNPNSNRNRTEDGRPICFKCNKPGHVARYCRVNPASTNSPTSGSRAWLIRDTTCKMTSTMINTPLEKLNDQNYRSWKYNTKMMLIERELWKYVTEPTPDEEASRTIFNMKQEKALAMIALTISPSQQIHIMDCTTAREAWDTLEQVYEPKSRSRILQLKKQFISIRFEEQETMTNYLGRLKICSDHLREAGAEMQDQDLAYSMLAGLPESYDGIIMTFSNVEDKEFTSSKEGRQEEENFTCYKCGKEGHIARSCRGKAKTPTPNFQPPRCSTHEIAGSEMLTALSCAIPDNSWVIDSGATHHVCNKREWFTNFQGITSDPILTASGTTRAEGCGDIKFKAYVGKHHVDLKLCNVLYVPNVRRNLLSVSSMGNKGKIVNFENRRAQVFDSENRIVAIAHDENGLYVMKGRVILPNAELFNSQKSSQKQTLELWHQRFCHVNNDAIERMAKGELVKGLEISSMDRSLCDDCCVAKSTKEPHKPIRNIRSKRPLELVHTDICGPMPVRSIGGSAYFLTFIDDYSRKITLFCLKHKNEVLKHFDSYLARAERETGHKLKVLISDNGLEYCNHEFKTRLEQLGIKHELTNTYSPPMNGVAERANRVLLDITRSCLHSADLPQRFWAEAVNTAAYIRNKCYNSALGDKVPDELWSSRKPSVRHLKAFGCLAYSHIPTERRKKLDNRANRCILVGYSSQTKGYRLWCPETQHVIQTKHVKFDESKIGLKWTKVEDEPERYNHIWIEPDNQLEGDIDLKPEAERECNDDTSDQDLVGVNNDDIVQTRPKRIVRNPYGRAGKPKAELHFLDIIESTTFEQAINSKEAPYWRRAMKDELRSLEDINTWTLSDLPLGKRPISSRWVFKIKTNSKGDFERFKARLVARGFSQKRNVDFFETYSPVINFSVIRMIFALTINKNCPPDGSNDEKCEDKVLKLNRPIYGLRQSGLELYCTLDKALEDIGFRRLAACNCLYTFEDKAVIAVYVDDLALFAESEDILTNIEEKIREKFKVKNLGPIKYFLGVEISYPDENTIILSQGKYTMSILERFNMMECRGVSTPLDNSIPITKKDFPTTDKEKDEIKHVPYRELIGSLLYLANSSRPDMTFAVTKLAQFCSNPGERHWQAAKHILRYLQATKNVSLIYKRGSDDILAFSDSDWANDIDDRRSTSGSAVTINGCLVSWRSKKQNCVSLSTMESEYIVLAQTTKEILWIAQILENLKCLTNASRPITIFCDNRAAIEFSKNNIENNRSKHIDIRASIEAEDGEYVIEENNKMTQTNGLRLARSLLTVTDKKTHIWITNPYPRPLKIMKDQTLAYGSLPAEVRQDQFGKTSDSYRRRKTDKAQALQERQEEAFQTLKTALLSPPILGHFNPNAPTYIHTDASNIGIGATLVQDIGGEEKVISYLSRTLSKAEQNYSTTEKECLAVVWSMSKLRPNLYGRHFKIVTDHHALCWLKNLKDPTGRLARWALKIQEYDFDIIHKSGKKHLDADGLSRGPLPETDWDEDFERLFLNQITDEEDKFIESVKKNLNGSRRSIAQNFKEEDGCLFKKNPNPKGRAWLLVVPEKKKREIMKEYHNHMSNGHLGVARTMYQIKSKYFWLSMLKDVSEFVKTCHLCQSTKGSNQLPSGLLQPIPPANFPFERIGIDFVGPLPSTKNRKKWIIVLTDYYTRYAETRAVSEATVKEVSKFLVEDIFLRHGAPQYLISDRGSQFTSNLMKEVMKTCKIKHCFTTSYHPQTNGLTERLNRTLINMLSMYVNTDQKNWDEILPFITHAYNTTIQETTGYSPFFLMFGREPTSLLDDRNISVDIDKDDYDEYIKHHLDKINKTRKLVINNTIKTQERMKKNYDKKHMERSYKPGELVAVWTPIRKIGKCEKLLRKYFGPYRILKKLSNVNYLIEPKDNPGQDPLIVHVSRIKPYFERIDEVNHEDTTSPSPPIGAAAGNVWIHLTSGQNPLAYGQQKMGLVFCPLNVMAGMDNIKMGMNIPKLEGLINWPEYKKNIKLLLTINKVIGVVDGTYRKPIKQETNEEKEAYVKWESEDAISQLLFTTSVMPDVSQLIIPCSSAKDMWDKLLSVYEQSSGQRLDMLYNQFFNFKKDPTDDISKHISKLESLRNDMQNELTKQENLKLPESMLMCRIINTLPDEYFDFKSVWESVSKEERSVDNLRQRLRLLEIRIQQRDECSASSSTALMANAYENKQNMKGKVTKSNENFQKTRETRECYFCHRKGHLAKDCSESLISERFNEQDEDIWIGDSGATNHITRNASFYTSYKDFPTQQTVKVGSNLYICITIETCVKGKWQTHYLTDVWYVPNFSRNVMSLQSTLDKGFEMKMDKKGCKLFKTTTGEVIVEGKRLPGGLYGMLITSIKPENAAEVNLAKTQNVNMLQLWHERFGHQNKRHVQKWLKEQGIDAVMDNEPCEACIYGKQHRLSFGSREQYASTQPGNLIHVDVCGPMQEVSKGGMRYFVCFKDDFTKYRSVYFLKEKSQVIEKLEQFLLETKTTGHIVKEILTDGGKEFVNKETSKITNKYGINHRITMPYTPQQNGSAERENRTLIEAARSMIYAKNMSLKLWAEAVNTATYVLNRTGPSQIEGKTPYELCNKDGYRIWMPNSNKVVTSRDVIFKETIPTFSLDIEKRNKEFSSNQIDEQNDTQDIEKIESNVQTSDVYNLRDRSNISKPQRYIDAEINIAEGLEPKTYKEAMDSPNAQFWKEAMNEEMNSLTENDVYECTTLPPGQKPIDCKWVLKTKLNSKGEITRYKARLVAKGFAQKKGIDYEETFSPVARHDTIRTLLAIAANEDLKLVQFDIKTAFLYGDLQDQIYIKQPEGFNNGTDLVWKLKKSLYGLKQSPRCWNHKIVNFMKERCLKESTADPCLFFRKTNDHLLIIAIYVDDGIIAGTNEQEIKEFLELMFSFKITSEPLNYFLGIEIERQPDGSIFINQKAYIKRILEKFNMSQANKVGTPTDNSTVPGEAEILENVPFREAIGSLMHLSCLTRPDITFALNKVSQKLAAPTKYDWEAVKRIFKYLVGTTEYGIMYQKGHKVGVLESFSDADFAGDPETRRSTSGVVCKLAGGAISWLSQKQRSVSLSTTEAELVVASNTAKEVIWLNRLFSEISPLKEQPIIKVDNASTIKLIKNPEFHKRTKHIEVRHYFVREKYQEGIFNVEHISGKDQVADIMTKGLPKPRFQMLRYLL